MDERLDQFLQSAGRPKVAVVGDMMLDIYVWGGVSRISQEGPIPVLRVERREQRTGGAGNVAAMLAALGARVTPVGLIGEDAAGRALRDHVAAAGMETDALVASRGRPTATKTRYLGYVHSAGRALQQIVRVDEEVTDHLDEEEAEAVLGAARSAMEGAELLVVQDMGKGLLAGATVRQILQEARERGLPAIVDPELTEDYTPYRGAACVVPNRYEAETATGLTLACEADYRRASRALLERLDLEAAVVKLDRDGMYFATADGEEGHVGTRAREVADITGAGDMVTAALAFARACGADYPTAVRLANFAAGLEVGLHGVAPIPRAEIVAAMRAEAEPGLRKIVPREQIESLAERLRAEGRRIAFTNGCFDLLHLGHARLLSYARAQGDVLIVGLNSDASARALKGPARPVNCEEVRGRILAALADVDYVVLFDEQSVLPLIEQVRPDVLVKGGDYTVEGVVGHELVQSYGGEVKLAPEVEGFSTTDLIERIARGHEGSD